MMFVTNGDLPAAQHVYMMYMIDTIDMINVIIVIIVIIVNENLIIAFGPAVPEPVEGRSKDKEGTMRGLTGLAGISLDFIWI